MITPIDLNNSHAVGFAVDGVVHDDDLQTVYKRIDEVADQHGRVRLYVELRSFPTFDSVRTLVQALRKKTKAFDQIEKYALVTDRAWLGKFTTAADYVTSSMDLRTFAASETESAQAWLLSNAPPEPTPTAIASIPLEGAPNVVGAAVNGKLRKSDYDELDRLLAAQPQATSLYLEIRQIAGLSLAAIMDELEADAQTLRRFEKAAIVGHQSWLPAATRVADWLTPSLDVRYFDLDDAAGALLWLGVRKNSESGLTSA